MKKNIVFLLIIVVSASSILKATHFWDCSGGACDSATLQPWDFSKYRYAPEYAPVDPNDHGGPLYGEKLWMTGAASDSLSALLGTDDGCCGVDGNRGGCGKCVLVDNPTALNSHWKVLVMKKNRCPPDATGCGSSIPHLDFAVPGYDNLQFSNANICGQSDTILSQAQSSVCGSWYNNGGYTTTGCDCSSLPSSTTAEQYLKKGCELFTEWGWNSGDPELNYEIV